MRIDRSTRETGIKPRTDPETLEGAATVSEGRISNNKKVSPLRDIVLSRCRQYYTLDIIDGLRRVSDEVSSTFQGSPGLDGMKVSDPRDDPVFIIKLPLSRSRTRSISVSSRLVSREIRNMQIDRPKLDRAEKSASVFFFFSSSLAFLLMSE